MMTVSSSDVSTACPCSGVTLGGGFEAVAWNRIHSCDFVNSAFRAAEVSPRMVSAVVLVPDTFFVGTVSARAGGLNVPAESAARYTWRPIVPAPVAFLKSAVPNARTLSTRDEPTPGKLTFWGALDALAETPAGTK